MIHISVNSWNLTHRVGVAQQEYLWLAISWTDGYEILNSIVTVVRLSHICVCMSSNFWPLEQSWHFCTSLL